MNSSGILAPEF